MIPAGMMTCINYTWCHYSISAYRNFERISRSPFCWQSMVRHFPLPDGLGQVKLPVRQVDLNGLFLFISYKQIEEIQITWANVDTDLCHHMTSLGHSELNYHWSWGMEEFYIPYETMDLTHWGQVKNIFVSKLGHNWFRYWLVAWPAPSHYLNQW